ncbi:hypothetical protein ACFFIY_01330 [Bhargavaea ullalensis]|uniref:Tfp pilus assembly protein PilP n=1 Tax=Bhargavaea ullalensis TaxID=1265685 RepID=A0ABV2G798_9BACL
MPNGLGPLLEEACSDNRRALELLGNYDHPAVILLRTALEDQENQLKQLVSQFRETDLPALEDIKTYCTASYHANEVIGPFFESWKRAVGWMDDPSGAAVDEVGPIVKDMKSLFEKAAVQLEKTYGRLEVKYVVPDVYFPAV